MKIEASERGSFELTQLRNDYARLDEKGGKKRVIAIEQETVKNLTGWIQFFSQFNIGQSFIVHGLDNHTRKEDEISHTHIKRK